ncbi:MAG: glycoside hydrolase family 127 protein [Flavisolibacter sp.]
MDQGSTGHLDEVYEKLKNDNGWLGGKGDGWEETPYWLDGALPLAWLVDDKYLKQKVKKYIDWVLNNQRPSGYFGPITKWERETGKKIDLAHSEKGEDWWPKMIMLKVLQQYYLATADNRVISFMAAFFHYQLQALDKSSLGNWSEWATARGADNIGSAEWLYGITHDPSLLLLCKKIKVQAFPWSQWFSGRSWVMNAAAQQNDKDWMQRHGVNVAMGLKDPIMNYQLTGEEAYLKALEIGWNDIMTLHGLPFGMFSADEDLHGNSPTQGTELCAIVETMHSLQQAIAMTGNLTYMDALERMTFNALPAQTTDDYNEKQYFQIANQVQISKGVFNFSLPFEREMNNVLGMRSGYTCCLANMHQGWTKFASHLWYATTEGGLAALQYGPNQIRPLMGALQIPITINEKTDFPFDDRIEFEIKTKSPIAFPLQLRIPGWCKNSDIWLNGKAFRSDTGGQIITISRVWKDGDHFILHLPMEVKTTNWGRNSTVIERGPLVYALKLKERWVRGKDEKEGNFYSVFPENEWNFGLSQSALRNNGQDLKIINTKGIGSDFAWNIAHAPLEIRVRGKQIPEWKIMEGVAPQPITDRTGIYRGKVSDSVWTLPLIPYGFTKVRIVAFPVVP